jgi:hypothetical protein
VERGRERSRKKTGPRPQRDSRRGLIQTHTLAICDSSGEDFGGSTLREY